MRWDGKIFGATVGFFLGGPLGAAIGGMVGHSFDDEEIELTNDDIYLVMTGCILGHVAFQFNYKDSAFSHIKKICKDIEYSQFAENLEIKMIREWGQDHDLFNQSIETAITSIELKNKLQINLWRLVSLTNSITYDEAKAVWRIAEYTEVTRIDYDLIGSMFFRKHESPLVPEKSRKLFFLEENFSPEELKTAFKKMRAKHHPDNVNQSDLKAVKEATKLFQDLGEAYQELQAFKPSKNYCIPKGTSSATQALPGDIVICLFCGINCRLPSLVNLPQSRCPDCHALLTSQDTETTQSNYKGWGETRNAFIGRRAKKKNKQTTKTKYMGLCKCGHEYPKNVVACPRCETKNPLFKTKTNTVANSGKPISPSPTIAANEKPNIEKSQRGKQVFSDSESSGGSEIKEVGVGILKGIGCLLVGVVLALLGLFLLGFCLVPLVLQ